MLGLWVTLVLVDLVSVATFARCFTGPGELVLLLPVCLLAHCLARIGRIVGRRTNRVGGVAVWLLAVLVVVWLPIAALDWHSLSWGLPLGRSQHLLASQFHAAWAIFSDRVAPVAENRGLVIASAWAAGAVGLAAEALDADATLPAIVALIPAFDIVVFTGTLGTSTGRAPELAALSAFAVAYLAMAARQSKGEQVVSARVEGSAAGAAGRRLGGFSPAAAANGSARRPAGRLPARAPGANPRGRGGKGLGSIAAPGLVVIAALAAGVIGPLLPGARSAALVAWHGGPGGHRGGGTQALNHPNGPITISNLVQVGEQEIDNPAVPLFYEYGPEPTREVLATLDVFNGNQWLAGGSKSSFEGSGEVVGTFAHGPSIQQLERHPPPLQITPQATTITQVISVAQLGGNELPAPGRLLGADNAGHVTLSAESGAAVTDSSLSGGETLVERADLDVGAEAVNQQLVPGATGAPSVDTSLPLPVPVSISALAQQWTESASTPLGKALAIQSHLTGGDYRYSLPKHIPSGASDTPDSGYFQLANFLYNTKAGYCQQFASAFAVMARIEGLPTRVVVGMLPGARVGHKDEWQVTGTDVHAWPQVYFKGTGWVDFEPTPGTSAPVVAVTPTTVTTTPVGSKSKTPTTFAHNFGHPTPSPRGVRGSVGAHRTAPLPQHGGAGVLDVVLALLAAAMLWVLGVPSFRLARLRRAERDPLRGVLAEWGASVRLLAAAGFHRRRAETFDEYALRVRRSGLLSAQAEAALARLVQATNRAVFGRTPPTHEEMRIVAGDATLVRRSARKSLAFWQQVLVQVDPRDLAHVS